MTDVGALVDRVFRDALYGGADQPLRTSLTAAVDVTATSWTVDLDVFAADEEELLGPGVIVEVGLEQALVTARSGATLTVRRGVNGTDAEAHGEEATVTVAPTFGRRSVFDAVADNVVGLYPSLWRVETAPVTVEHPLTEVPADVVVPLGFTVDGVTVDARLVERAPDFTSGMGAVIEARQGAEGFLTYRARFPRPESETDDLVGDLGLEPEWERIVLVGAVAQTLSGSPELNVVTQDFITESMAAEAFPAQTAGRLSDRLLRFQQFLLDRAHRDLRSRTAPRVSYMPTRRGALR